LVAVWACETTGALAKAMVSATTDPAAARENLERDDKRAGGAERNAAPSATAGAGDCFMVVLRPLLTPTLQTKSSESEIRGRANQKKWRPVNSRVITVKKQISWGIFPKKQASTE
jgi:hypothetical protein